MASYQLFLLLAAAALPIALPAQDAGRSGLADPETPGPPMTYRSAFLDYQPHRDTAVASWRETNEAVHRLGGHMGHVRAGAAPSASPSEPDAEKPPAPGGHGAHH